MPDLFVIQNDGEIFISMAYVERIPTSPPIHSRLLSQPLGFGTSSYVLLSHDGKLFLSLNYLNRLLAAPPSDKALRAVVAINASDGGNRDQRITINLATKSGVSVPLIDKTKSVNKNQLQDISEKRDANSVSHGQVVNRAAEQQRVETQEGERPSQVVQDQQEEGHQDQDDGPQDKKILGTD